MSLRYKLYDLFFPAKCVLCGKVLSGDETDLCHSCRTETQEYGHNTAKLPYLARKIILWYYEGTVRSSLLRFKFYNRRSHAQVYGRLLAMKLIKEQVEFDILTWVPISRLRKWRRGYDQDELIANAIGVELGVQPVPTLKKLRNNPPQSGMGDAARRKANVFGIYRCIDPALVAGKRILLLDDIVTTGATASECARVLLTAGAKEVTCAAVAAASHQRKNSR